MSTSSRSVSGCFASSWRPGDGIVRPTVIFEGLQWKLLGVKVNCQEHLTRDGVTSDSHISFQIEASLLIRELQILRPPQDTAL